MPTVSKLLTRPDSPSPVTYASTHEAPAWRRVLKRVAQVAAWTVTTAVVVVAILVFVIPQARAGSGLTILTGSMQPTIDPGDVVAVRGIKPHEVCDGTVEVGDIVTFMPNTDNGDLVTHRVVAIHEDAIEHDGYTDQIYENCSFTTRGDNNNVDDEPLPARALKGIVMYTVPKVGHLINAAQTRTEMRTVAIGLAVVFTAGAVYYAVGWQRPTPEPEYCI